MATYNRMIIIWVNPRLVGEFVPFGFMSRRHFVFDTFRGGNLPKVTIQLTKEEN